jgi:hypothetical protein
MSLTPPSVRTIAQQSGVDLKPLLGILELQRPAGSLTEEMFVEEVIGKIDGIQIDGYENYFLTIGDNPTIMWSCHTDTVAKDDGFQNLKWDGDFLELNEPKTGQCLGADDGAGLWLMLEMIRAKVPGLYVFHREEEIGGRGSDWIASKNPCLLQNIKMAIAFDRRDVDSVITHQGGRRTCSDAFGNAIAEMLNQVEGLKYCLDTGGSFTDTANYVDIIPECTNLSVGYYSEHSVREKLDVRHLLRLREALLSYDFSSLPVERNTSIKEYEEWPRLTPIKSSFDGLLDLIRQRPHSIAQIFHNMGLEPCHLEEMMYNAWQREPGPERDPDPNYEMWCDDCGDWVDATLAFSDECPVCFGRNTELMPS